MPIGGGPMASTTVRKITLKVSSHFQRDETVIFHCQGVRFGVRGDRSGVAKMSRLRRHRSSTLELYTLAEFLDPSVVTVYGTPQTYDHSRKPDSVKTVKAARC